MGSFLTLVTGLAAMIICLIVYDKLSRRRLHKHK